MSPWWLNPILGWLSALMACVLLVRILFSKWGKRYDLLYPPQPRRFSHVRGLKTHSMKRDRQAAAALLLLAVIIAASAAWWALTIRGPTEFESLSRSHYSGKRINSEGKVVE